LTIYVFSCEVDFHCREVISQYNCLSHIKGIFPTDDGSAAGGSEAMEKRAPLDGKLLCTLRLFFMPYH
jgi:hypothetical protein